MYPEKTKSGTYAELILASYCGQNKYYDQSSDSCL